MNGQHATAKRIADPAATVPPSDEALIARFAPVFEQLRASSPARERAREHPFAEVAELRRLGFGALRLPVELGGHGASLRQLFRLLVELGAAESNLPQALRQHFFRVELALLEKDTAQGRRWLERIAAGEIFGNGTTEPHGARLGEVGTRLTRTAEGYRLNGRKIYGTGNLYADWIPVAAVDPEGEPVNVIVSRHAPGVQVLDDWDGFGQRLTGTDTTVFTDVAVRAADVTPAGAKGGHHGGGFHQLVLVATLAGIARAARDDMVADVRGRTRIYALTGTGVLPRHDPIIQEAVGRVESTVAACLALTDQAAAALDRAWTQWSEGQEFEAVDCAFIEAEIVIDTAQVVLSREVVDVAGRIFDSLGASSTLAPRNLDRHWRNARTVATHNSPLFRARVIGDYLLNGTPPKIFQAGHDVGDKPADAAPA
jgi:alkylation response protein AidB-like acyl-CoA dehydrogenase